ncbi:MAG TPA: TlpA disulfide reductase family protein [Tepidisphaeraceae bacterium]|nr:TlpA disulfide reductase family protein [Tepidisphaeraceae bacterium]
MMAILYRIPTTMFLLAAVSGVAGENSPERYNLAPGQEIRYDTVDDFALKDGTYDDQVQWIAWVARRNDDGSAHIVLRTTTSSQQIQDGKPVTTSGPRMDLVCFDLFPDGRCVNESSYEPRWASEACRIFPMLPGRVTDQSWVQQMAFAAIHYSRADSQANARDFVFEGRRESPESAIYLISDTNTFHFDSTRGLVAEVQNRNSQGYGMKGAGRGKTTLTGVEARSAEWIAKLDRESKAYFASVASYERDLELALNNPDMTDGLLLQGQAGLRAAREKMTLPDLIRMIDEAISNHNRFAEYAKEESRLRARTLNHPAIDWSLHDLSGKSHALSDYRGKIVVLDFWYRGCQWCIRAMPQIERITDVFKNDPVIVLGMNTDEDARDAKFVVEKLGLTCDVLRVDPRLPELAKCGVRGFPTLLIIDQRGIVRGMYVGYSSDLYQKVEQDVRNLLKAAR